MSVCSVVRIASQTSNPVARNLATGFFSLVAIGSGFVSASQDRPQAHFVDVASSVGVTFTYFNDYRAGRFWVPEIMGGGAGWVDFNGDGWQDLYLVNGCRQPRDPNDGEFYSRLVRNIGGKFEDVTSEAGVGHVGFGQGCTVGDFDNDGFDDFYVTTYGTNALYINHGDGTFENLTESAGVPGDPRWYSSCAFGDLDRNGSLDLYVAAYLKVPIDDKTICVHQSTKQRVYCGPARYPAEEHTLYRNRGDGAFQDATRESGCTTPLGRGLGVVVADFDDDAWPDIYVANDMTVCFLYQNQTGSASSANGMRFQEIGVRSGVALTGDGSPIAGMGIACGDYDGSGRLSLFVTNYYGVPNILFRGHGRFLFTDESAASGLARPSLHKLGFGTAFLDFENDGWPDLVVANGHVLGPTHEPFAMRPQLFRNNSKRKFEDVSDKAGPYFEEDWVGRGVAISDFDNDGASDIAVVHQFRPTSLLHNETRPRGHFVRFELVGTQSNRNAVNARVWVESGGRTLMSEILGGGSYLSASDRRLLFGLGDQKRVDTVRIRWPSGREDVWQNLDGNRSWLLIEGWPPKESQP
jgi:hypothetical protein